LSFRFWSGWKQVFRRSGASGKARSTRRHATAPTPPPGTPHVALFVETSRTYGREILRGVNRWIQEHESWSVFLELRGLDSSVPRWLRSSRVKALLVETDLTLAEIADRCGMEHPQYLAASFKKQFGITPGAFRRKHGVS
jgi:AraC-like DNA-binding protein